MRAAAAACVVTSARALSPEAQSEGLRFAVRTGSPTSRYIGTQLNLVAHSLELSARGRGVLREPAVPWEIARLRFSPPLVLTTLLLRAPIFALGCLCTPPVCALLLAAFCATRAFSFERSLRRFSR